MHPCPHFDDGKMLDLRLPFVQVAVLQFCTVGNPSPVIEHQDVRPGKTLAFWTDGQRGCQLAVFFINLDFEAVGLPDAP